MFPIPFNFPFIRKNGTRTTIGAAIAEGGGGDPYELPTASTTTKGGVKIGTGLVMDGEVLNATGGGGGGLSIVDIDTYQVYDAGASTFKQIGLSAMISETDFNTHLSGKTILAINVIDNPKIHLMGISGTTLSDIRMGYFADSPSSIAEGTTLRFLVADNPS